MASKMQSIGKFVDVFHEVKRNTYYVETKEDGTVITDETRKLPTIEFLCTPKLHGTFAGVRYDRDANSITAMSKGNDITIEKDNAGFAQFVENRKEHFLYHLSNLAEFQDLEEVSLMGEFIGPGIQKGVGINLIKDKTFVMFGIKFKQKDQSPRWAQLPAAILRQISDKDFRIRSIFEFDTEVITVDFNHSKDALIKLDELRDKIENRCPVAEKMLEQEKYPDVENVKLIGEGFVAVGFNSDGQRYIFKHKGEEHAKTKKTKQPKQEDPKAQEKLVTAEKVTPTWRLEQAVRETNAKEMKDLGTVIKWVIQDIIKEEQAVFRETNFTIKDLNKYISVIVRDWYKNNLNEVLN